MGIYEKLPTSQSTRVLRFKPPSLADEDSIAIHCDWEIISMADPGPYYALSYVWGDPNVREYDLICNGHSVKITYNLRAALREVWTRWPDKKLWVDAVCINQDDIPERNQQVGMMGSIYRNAESVAIWLGDATSRSDDFFEALRVVELGGKPSPADCQRFKPGPKKHNPGWYVHDAEREFATYLLDAGDDITRRPWFVRVWTLQEFQLSSDAVILCGRYVAKFELLIRTVREINSISSGMDFCGARTVSIPIFGQERYFRTLYRILAWTQSRKSTDPRDKIFSLLSMLSPNLYGFMKPDYHMSVEETFTWACRVCIEIDNEMNCLAGGGLHKNEGSDLPSWVVDWRKPNSDIHTWQNLSRSLERAAASPEICRDRYERGRRLDKASKEIHIPGIALGRLEVDRTQGIAFLTAFPICVMQCLKNRTVRNSSILTASPICGMQCLKNRTARNSSISCIKLSSDEFLRSFQAVQQHGTNWCQCMRGERCDAYQLRDMPEGVETGDWLWTTETIDKCGKAEEEEDRKDEIRHFHYALHPVPESRDARFQLLGKTNGLLSIWETMNTGKPRTAYTRWQATFLFI